MPGGNVFFDIFKAKNEEKLKTKIFLYVKRSYLQIFNQKRKIFRFYGIEFLKINLIGINVFIFKKSQKVVYYSTLTHSRERERERERDL